MKKERKLSDMNFLEKFVSKFDRSNIIAFILVSFVIILAISIVIILTQIGPPFLGSYILAATVFVEVSIMAISNSVEIKKKTKEIEDIIEKALKTK